MNPIVIYKDLLDRFGPQNWWPRHAGEKRPGFDPRFEIMVGAVLTQNTAWRNVEKAMEALFLADCLDAEAVCRVQDEELKGMIRPAGYFNQKAKKLKLLAAALLGRSSQLCGSPSRDELLSIWGIGPETADSILLYALGEPVFVVDTYTRRLLRHHGEVGLAEAEYDEIQAWFQDRLPKDAAMYNEFHALIVAWAKEHGKPS